MSEAQQQSLMDLLRGASEKLAAVGNACARRDAELLLAHIAGVEPSRLPLVSSPISEPQQRQFQAFLERRLAGEPVAHIVGEQAFWSLEFHVTPATLVPRPDTETLVEMGLAAAENIEAPRILDIGTGSGCILLSLLHELPDASGVGLDISADALAVAERNAARHGLGGRVDLLESDLLAALPDASWFDLIVSNPPYIPSDDIADLMADVRDHEPLNALDGGADGLDFYRKIAEQAPLYLKAGGMLAVEVGIHQAADVAALWLDQGLASIDIRRDLGGIERVVSGKKQT